LRTRKITKLLERVDVALVVTGAKHDNIGTVPESWCKQAGILDGFVSEGDTVIMVVPISRVNEVSGVRHEKGQLSEYVYCDTRTTA